MVPFPPVTVRQPRRTTSSTTPCGYAASARGSRASSPHTRDDRQLHPMASVCTNEIRGWPVGDRATAIILAILQVLETVEVKRPDEAGPRHG
jgi:hypothetical protein